MKWAEIVACAAVVCVLALSASRSDSNPGEPGSPQGPAPSEPAPDRRTVMFRSYDPGPPEALWSEADLTPAERVVTNRGKQEDLSGVHAAYNVAVRERAHRARGEGAAIQLGIEHLDSLGVVE
jgi:hypothetical protein